MALKRFIQPAKVIELGKFSKDGTSIMKKATRIKLRVDESAVNNYHYPNLNGAASNAMGSVVIDLDVEQYYVGPNDELGNPTYGSLLSGNGMISAYPTSIAATGQDYVKVVYKKDELGEVVLGSDGKPVIDIAHPENGKFLVEVVNATMEHFQDGGLLDCDFMYDNELFREIYYKNIINVEMLVERFILGHAQRGKFNL